MIFKFYLYLYYSRSQYINDIRNKNFNQVIIYASKNGHIDIVKLMLDNGANNFNSSIKNASENGHNDIVKLILDNSKYY